MLHFAHAQSTLTLSLFSESISLPSYKVVKGINPGINIGTEFVLKQKPKGQRILTANLGLYYHKRIHYGIFLSSEFGYRYQSPIGIDLEALVGLGYLHTFWASKTYQRNDDGTYAEKKTFGRPHIAPSASIGLAYDFSRKADVPIALFTKYQLFVETPFAAANGIPVLPHTTFHIGARIYLNQRRE